MAKIYPCKFCKRGRVKVHNSNKIGSQIIADKCIHCLGKGYIVEDENIIKHEDINDKGGNNGILDKR